MADRKAPKPPLSHEPRMTELIGLTDDGRMALWSKGMVQPVDRFETSPNGPWIKSGHYVIEWKGHAITVHCNSWTNGSNNSVVGVLFMCGRGGEILMPREEVEAMLIGKVIRDPVHDAEILDLLQKLADRVAAQQDTPARQRGRIT